MDASSFWPYFWRLFFLRFHEHFMNISWTFLVILWTFLGIHEHLILARIRQMWTFFGLLFRFGDNVFEQMWTFYEHFMNIRFGRKWTFYEHFMNILCISWTFYEQFMNIWVLNLAKPRVLRALALRKRLGLISKPSFKNSIKNMWFFDVRNKPYTKSPRFM